MEKRSKPLNPSSIGLRAALSILQRWSVSTGQAKKILRITDKTYSQAISGRSFRVRLDKDQLLRASLILNIHATLRATFNNAKNIYGFMSMNNHNEFFNGTSPLNIIIKGDIISLYGVYLAIRRIPALVNLPPERTTIHN